MTMDVFPLHRIGVALAVAFSCGEPTIVMVVVAAQLFASVTVNVYVPGGRLKTPVPLYGGVPPVAATVMVALPVVHETGVALEVALTAVGGWVMFTETVAVQLFASVTLKL